MHRLKTILTRIPYRALFLETAALGGLTALAVGLWWERPSAALIVVGSLVFFSVARTLSGSPERKT